ncbi:signal peptidase I [Massilia sp. BJB1822]|uniref:signal peptidase I n=1 Tax=Massilia sp. BJB1822 TaxID=2744470 RepID=UPI001594BFF3|nr:signal peptidase I [Massilia sp. BJB1822]NVD96845.1 signal peptidase I [Massilia sp. BJB1822]
MNLFFMPLGFLYAGRWRAALGMGVLVLLLGLSIYLDVPTLPAGLDISHLRLVLGVVAALWAYRAARQAPEGIRPWYSSAASLIGISVLVVLADSGVRNFLYIPFKAASDAMAPALQAGDKVVVQKYGYGHYTILGTRLGTQTPTEPIRRGDILVFDAPAAVPKDNIYLMRVVGLPGDRIVYRNKELFINDQRTRLRPDGEYLLDDGLRPLQRMRNQLDGTAFSTIEDPNKPAIKEKPRDFPFRDHCSYSETELHCEIPPGHYYLLGDNRDNSNDSRYWGFLPASHIVGKVVKTLH